MYAQDNKVNTQKVIIESIINQIKRKMYQNQSLNLNHLQRAEALVLVDRVVLALARVDHHHNEI